MTKLPTPANKKKNQQRAPSHFLRFQSDMFRRVDKSWRRIRGIDNRARRRYKGNINIPKIGMATAVKTRNLLPNGFYKFRVHNVAELEMLLMHNRTYCAEIAGNVSSKSRAALVKRASELNVRVLNAKARLTAAESE